jgi:IS5 family transposase
MQYFVCYSSFSNEAPFDPSLFVEFRKRLGIEQINAINEKILQTANQQMERAVAEMDKNEGLPPTPTAPIVTGANDEQDIEPVQFEPPDISHAGKLVVDATTCPQDIGYPTNLNLNDSRENAEELIDFLFIPKKHGTMPQTYRQRARKDYLKTALFYQNFHT